MTTTDEAAFLRRDVEMLTRRVVQLETEIRRIAPLLEAAILDPRPARDRSGRRGRPSGLAGIKTAPQSANPASDARIVSRRRARRELRKANRAIEKNIGAVEAFLIKSAEIKKINRISNAQRR